MRRILAYFLAGYLFMVLQTAFLPHLLPFHLKPDLLLIYRKSDSDTLRLARLGSHSELFS